MHSFSLLWGVLAVRLRFLTVYVREGGERGETGWGGVRDAIWGDFFAMHLTKLCGMKARTELYRFSLIAFKGL